MEHELEDFDRGLAFDLGRLMERRNALKLFAGAGALAMLAACGSDAVSSAASSAGTVAPDASAATTAATTAVTTGSTTDGTGGAATCTTVVPEETAGPYPGDGSNGPDILTEPDVVRSDITTSIGSFTGTAEGVPTTVALTVLDSSNGCAPLVGGAVYLWHADKDGHYSMYSAPDASYLRGVQETDASGTVTFQSIWPGCYDGRWPHIHFEVYPTLADALEAGNRITTSQIAMPQDACQTVYAASGYETSVGNLTRVSLATDNVFRDGWDQELATASGNNDSGWTASLTITV